MKIRTQFIINVVVLGLILLLVSAAVIITNQWVESTHQQEELASQIEREAYELGYLANDYLLYRESQQASRWESKLASFSDHLSKVHVSTSEQQALLANIKTNQQRLEAVFAEVRSHIESAPQTQEAGSDEKFMQVSWSRLEVQNQGMIFDASRLEEMLNEQEHRLERLASLLGLVLIGLLGVFLLVNYGLTFRRILQALAELQDGTRIIGSGDLDFAIPVKNEDEIGELSHSFNQMTANLKRVTASKADLEKEITERKQAERAQQLERARWQGIVEGIADEVWTCDTQGKMSLLNLEAVTAMGLDIFKDKSVEEVYQEVEIFYPDGQLRPPEQAPLLHSLRGEIVRGEEIMRHRQTGITRYRQFSSAPTRDANGTITGAVAIVRDVTDQKVAEEGLRRYELLSSHSRDIILFMRREDGRILEANTAATQAYGYSREEMLGLTIRDLRAPDTLGLTAEQIAQADAGGILFETVHLRKDGTTFPVEVSSQGATIGSVRTLISIIRDITERKEAEEKVRRSEAMLRAILDQMPSGVTVRDAHTGTLILSNARSREIMGALVDSANQFAQYRGFHPDGRPYQPGGWPLSRSMATGEVVHAEEVAYERSDGIRITLSINSAPVRDPQGQIVMGVGVFDDITARKQAEEHSAYQARLLANVNDAIVGSDAQFRLTAWNASAESMYGWKAEEVLGRNGVEVLRTQWPQADADEMRHTIAETGRWRGEATQLRKDGTRIPVQVSSIVLRDENDQITGYVSVNHDITARKQAEEELHRLTEDLRRSNAELEQFAYVASHDLQEPLRMISSYVQLLARRYQGKLDSDADEFIDFAVDGAKRMQNLINDLLAYSRVGTRSNPLVPVPAEDLLNEAVANLQFLIEESGAKITHEPLPVVNADFTQLVTVFQNLLANAIKFRSAEPPCIHIAARQAEEELIFSVSDNGIGIDPKFAERIFVIFQRLNDRTAYPGTGIGLAICKRVIQRHRGRIWVESKPAEGATLYFTLPVKETL